MIVNSNLSHGCLLMTSILIVYYNVGVGFVISITLDECKFWSAYQWADCHKVLMGNCDLLKAERRKMALKDDPSSDPLYIPGLSGRSSSLPLDRNIALSV